MAARWEPSPELGLDPGPLIDALLEAAGREERWLLHPCANPLTLARDEWQLQRDFQLAVWVAAHVGRSPGQVEVPKPLWAWSPSGGVGIQPGLYDLGDLGAATAGDEWPWPIAFDTWGRSVGSAQEQAWATRPPLTPAEKAELQREVTQFLRASVAAERGLGALYRWVTEMTQVVVPLRRVTDGPYSRSSSCRQLRGVVFLTIHDEVQILEALVHETAHQYLFLAEGDGPLVDPSHQATYHSPLRVDPRPLIGILLAYHALAYISAYYVDALRGGLVAARRGELELRSSREKLRDSERTLVENRRFLTDAGREFLQSTMQVAGYADE